MSATTFAADLFPAQSFVASDGVGARAPSARKTGLFTRMMEAIGRAYSIQLPNGEVIMVHPF